MNMKAAYWILVPLCLCLTGCEQWDKLFLDDVGKPSIPEQEFSWFMVNVFRLVLDNPLRFLGCVVGLFLLLLFGGALWSKGGIWKLVGIILVVAGITVYSVVVGVVYIFLAMAIGVMLGAGRKS